MTRFYFMAGLPRAGSNVLGALMNQNPDVCCTPQTNTPEVLKALHQEPAQYESVRLGVTGTYHAALLEYALTGLYSTTDKPSIIDKNRMWGAPYFFTLLTGLLGEPPRIIAPVRPLAEVIASFVRKASENPETNWIDREMVEADFFPYWRKPLDDARVDWLLRPGGLIDGALLSLAGAFRDETSASFHLVPYADLVAEPGKTLDGIYDFLGLPRYAHEIDLVPAGPRHADGDVLGVPDLHTVRPTLSITAPPPETVLSDYAMSRCALEDYWTEH